MYYLKCNNCGYLNALKSEYATFCDHCGKKLQYNFSSWKLEHPGGDFNKFKEEVGVTGPKAEAERKAFKRKISPQTRKIALIAVVIVICVVAGAFATQFGRRVAKSFSEIKAPAEWLTSNWKPFSPLPSGVISLQLPVNLVQYKQTLPVEMAARVKSDYAYQNGDKDGLKINLVAVQYADSLSVNIDSAAKAVIEEMEAQKDYSQFDYNQKEITINGRPAIVQTGSYVYKASTALQFQNLIVSSGDALCRILMTYGAADDNGNLIAGKLIQSVKIKG